VQFPTLTTSSTWLWLSKSTDMNTDIWVGIQWLDGQLKANIKGVPQQHLPKLFTQSNITKLSFIGCIFVRSIRMWFDGNITVILCSHFSYDWFKVLILRRTDANMQARNQGCEGGQRPPRSFFAPLEKCVGHSSKTLDIVQKIWVPLGKLFAPPGVPSWLRAC